MILGGSDPCDPQSCRICTFENSQIHVYLINTFMRYCKLCIEKKKCYYPSKRCMSGLLLRPTIAPRKLHCRIAPFWPRSQPSSRRNDVRNGSIGICWMMELRCWGSLFGPPSSVRSPLSKWPRTPIPHLRYGNFTTLSDTSLHTLHNDIFNFYFQDTSFKEMDADFLIKVIKPFHVFLEMVFPKDMMPKCILFWHIPT